MITVVSFLLLFIGSFVWYVQDKEPYNLILLAPFKAESAHKLGLYYIAKGENKKALYWFESAADRDLYGDKMNSFYNDEKSQYYFHWSQDKAQKPIWDEKELEILNLLRQAQGKN